MSTWIPRVHLDRDGRARCGRPQGVPIVADAGAVTCAICLNLLAGTHNVGVRGFDPKPCGTPAAYRRHLRQEGKPVRCESCLQAERRREPRDGYNELRRELYRLARQAGDSAREAYSKRSLRRAS